MEAGFFSVDLPICEPSFFPLGLQDPTPGSFPFFLNPSPPLRGHVCSGPPTSFSLTLPCIKHKVVFSEFPPFPLTNSRYFPIRILWLATYRVVSVTAVTFFPLVEICSRPQWITLPPRVLVFCS